MHIGLLLSYIQCACDVAIHYDTQTESIFETAPAQQDVNYIGHCLNIRYGVTMRIAEVHAIQTAIVKRQKSKSQSSILEHVTQISNITA